MPASGTLHHYHTKPGAINVIAFSARQLALALIESIHALGCRFRRLDLAPVGLSARGRLWVRGSYFLSAGAK